MSGLSSVGGVARPGSHTIEIENPPDTLLTGEYTTAPDYITRRYKYNTTDERRGDPQLSFEVTNSQPYTTQGSRYRQEVLLLLDNKSYRYDGGGGIHIQCL